METKRFYKIPEISEVTGIPRSSLYMAIRRGEVQALRLGAAVYVPRAEVLRLLGEESPTARSGAALTAGV